MDIILNNAFRILGLPVPASKKEIIRRAEEIEPLITIGQIPTFDTDFSWISKVERNEETLKKALQALENQNTKLKHLLSWFWIIDSYDKRAIDALKSGDVVKAIEIWSNAPYELVAFENVTIGTGYHHKKNLATLEQILTLTDADSDQQHLKGCMSYWSELTVSNQLYHLIEYLDSVLARNTSEDELIPLIGDCLMRTTEPVLERWDKGGYLDKIGDFFKYLDTSKFTKEVVNLIKNKYTESIIEKIEKMCSIYSDDRISDYEDIYIKTKEFSEKVKPLVEKINLTGDFFLIEIYGDKIGEVILNNSIAYGNKTSEWQNCIELCELAGPIIQGILLKERLEKNLEIIKKNIEQDRIWGNLQPIDEAPSLHLINGCGTVLYGQSNYDSATNSYEATRYFVIFGIPIIPLGRYRVINFLNRYKFLGKLPLRTFDKWHIGIVISAIIVGFLILAKSSSNSSSDSSYSSSRSTTNSESYHSSEPKTGSSPIYSYPYRTSTNSNIINTLKQKIDNAKWRLTTMETELSSLQSRLEGIEFRLKLLKEEIQDDERKAQLGIYVNEFAYKNNINEYNSLVNNYNFVLVSYQTKYAEYKTLYDETSLDITRYNNLIGAK